MKKVLQYTIVTEKGCSLLGGYWMIDTINKLITDWYEPYWYPFCEKDWHKCQAMVKYK